MNEAGLTPAGHAHDDLWRLDGRVALVTGALWALRPETKGQAAACPDWPRAIPCNVRVGLPPDSLRRVDSNSSDHRQAAATGDSA